MPGEKYDRNLALYRGHIKGESTAELAREYNISQANAYDIIKRVRRKASHYGVIACQSFGVDPVQYARGIAERMSLPYEKPSRRVSQQIIKANERREQIRALHANGLSNDEIATRVGVSAGIVRARLKERA